MATLLSGKVGVSELKAQLASMGLTKKQIVALEAAQPDYKGHRKCPSCDEMIMTQTGGSLERCPECNWCRHATLMGNTCAQCLAVNPVIPELGPEMFQVYFADEQGEIVRTETH